MSKGGNIGLWVVQGLLAALFGMAGAFKTFTPLAELEAQMPWVAQAPGALVRFVGVSELLGAVGLILPWALGVLPFLTPLAAGGLVVVMILGAVMHGALGEWASLPVNVILGGLAASVAWGRRPA